MSARLKALAGALLCGVIGFAMPAGAQEALTQARLNNADGEPQNWLMPNQNYGSQRYSRLTEINRDTVAGLRVAFTVPLNDCLRGRNTVTNSGQPLVDGGFMFIEGCSGFLYKIDLNAGNYGTVLWTANAGLAAPAGGSTRGSFMYGDSVVMAVNDGRVVRVNRESGEIVYDVQIARIIDAGHSRIEPQTENFTSNPMVMENLIIVGNANGDGGTRGWLQAVNFDNGERVWRFYTVPGPGEFGHETWADAAGTAWQTGGASIWTSGSYDVAQRLFIQGTAQPVPMFDPEYRPGDNLFSNSAIALAIDTGALVWFFQYTPNESWDYDEQGIHILVNAPFNGQDRMQVVHFGRNGFFYQLDGTNGGFISGTQYVEQLTWTAGLDPKTGKPVEYDPNLTIQTYIPATRWLRADTVAKQACPQLPGGVRWQTPAVNPVTMVAYVSGEDGCQNQYRIPSVRLANGEIDEQGRNVPGNQIPGGALAVQDFQGLLAAVDLTTGALLHRVHIPFDGQAGVTATAGGIIIIPWGDGSIRVYNDVTLEQLWAFYTGAGNRSPVSSFEINGKQYLATIAGAIQVNRPELGVRGWGNTLYVFTL